MLNAQIIRNGEAVKLGWSFWHLVKLVEATETEGVNIMDTGKCVLQQDHTFTDTLDGEVFELKVGDEINVWRGI